MLKGQFPAPKNPYGTSTANFKMSPCPPFFFFGILCGVLLVLTEGYNYFEGLQGIVPCFEARTIHGCTDTLLSSFQPSVNSSGGNKPETGVFLFTRLNRKKPEFLHDCGGTLPSNTNFNPQHKSVILIHGFLDTACVTLWNREIRDELFKRDEYNVIIINYSWGNGPDYFDATQNIKIVSEQVAFVIQNIMDVSDATPESFHIVGHSLGAQAAGLIGKIVKGLGRITGLDPAGPGFRNTSPESSLNASDANIVDVLHTASGTCLPNFGDISPLGDADFYINGGNAPQIPCITSLLGSALRTGNLVGLANLVPFFCSHTVAIEFFKVSINPEDCEFVGVECSSNREFQSGRCRTCAADGSNCAVMGMDFVKYFKKDDKLPRKYYLNSGIFCPYCDNSDIQLNGFPYSS